MASGRRLVLLGIDGQDPRITERLLRAGRLPAFARLAESGCFARLRTTNPAQSPVAWTTMATGANPGYHGVFDFLRPVPDRMLIDLAIMRPVRGPTGQPAFERVRKVDAFWDLTTRAGVYTSVIRWPVTFPAERVSGHFLSGLGTPDIQGHLGAYLFFCTQPPPADDKSPQRVRRLRRKGSRWAGAIEGPRVAGLVRARQATVAFELEVHGRQAVLHIAGHEPVTLRPGEWSGWVRLQFRVGARTVRGICKCLLLGLGEDCRLYVSPVEIDPRAPCFPISWPEELAAGWAAEGGLFHTLGSPEDTKGVTDGRFGPEGFLETCEEVMEERAQMLRRELAALPDEGVLAVVFDTLDRVQHMFWAGLDDGHPYGDESWRRQWGSIIDEFYVRFDELVGEVLEGIGDDTVLMVFSDHGFTTFRRAVHLNRWLVDNGYMTAAMAEDDNQTTLFRTVRWERTVAYACGFGCIYLNLKGREARGIVEPGEEAEKLRAEIASRLVEELRDEAGGGKVVREAFVRDELFEGPHVGDAPDVVVGFEPGYRASWQTAIGGGLRAVIEDNAEPWSGDHLVHPECVPGVLFVNRRGASSECCAADIGTTVVRWFGLKPPDYMRGRALLEPD